MGKAVRAFYYHQKFVPKGLYALFIPPAFMPRGIQFSSFPFLHSYVPSFILTAVPFMELLQSFTCKQLERSISHQTLIRKHSYLDHRYLGGSDSTVTPHPRVHAPGWGKRSKSRTLLKSVFYFSVLESTYADIWSDMAQPCDIDLWVMK